MEPKILMLLCIFSIPLVLVHGSNLPLQMEYSRPPLKSSGSPPLLKNFKASTKELFLPKTVHPLNYNLRLRPILEPDWIAPGSVKIQLQCIEASNQVTLHKDPSLVVNDETIQLFQINDDGSHGNKIEVSGASFNDSTVFYTIHFLSELLANERYELSMDFTTVINEGAAGLYRAEYATPTGEIRYMATTQFQSYGARMAFPCFDEPGIKSTYDISIARKTDQTSLCNTLPKAVGVADPALPTGWVWDIYNTTMPMSSYLVAIIVSDFVCEEADPSIFLGRPVRICGPPHQINDYKLGVVSAEAAAKTMKFLEDTFKYPYEMYKIDNAAIPRNYFAPGAMENWGLITYRDNYVLYWPGESTEADRQGVFSILFHEMGHQWFGDLLTCSTWAHVWLNEGFATYVGGLIQGAAPEFDTEREFLWDKFQSSLAYDVGRDEPVYNENGNSGGSIIYGKGGSLLRMVRGVFGTEIFYQALEEYLRVHAYQPVTQDQLFSVLNEYAHAYSKIPEDITMKEIMDTWTLQPGYPVLRVARTDSNNILITQQEFLPADVDIGDKMWEVPVAVATASNPDFSNHTPALWLNRDSSSQNLEHDTSTWIVINPDAMGYYRVLYDDYLLTLIHNQLVVNRNVISGLSRADLIDDYFNFAEHGHTTIEKALEFTKHLENEDDYVVWLTVFSHSSKSRMMLGNERAISDYLLPKLDAVLGRFLIDWTLPLGELGIGTKVVLTSKLLDWACALGSDHCKNLAVNLFREWMNQPENLGQIIPPDFQSVMLCHGVSQSGQEGYEFLLDKYSDADPFGLLKGRFMNALSCAESEFLEGFILENVLQLNDDCDSACITKSDVSSFLKKVVGNSEARQLVVKILRENAKKVVSYVGPKVVADVVTSLSTFYNTEEDFKMLVSLIIGLEPTLSTETATLYESLDKVRQNIEWMNRFGNSINKWFQDNSS